MTGGVKEVKEGISKKELRLHVSFFFSEHCGYQVLTVKLFANYVHFSVFFCFWFICWVPTIFPQSHQETT